MDRIKNDNEIVREVLDGNAGAYAALLDRHLAGVSAFAERYLRNAHDAEDVAQETFVRAWKYLKQFDPSKNFKTWLFAIAKHAALDVIKKKRPLRFSEIGEEEGKLDAFLAPYLDGGTMPDAAAERVGLRETLQYAMGAIPQHYRTVLAMRYQDNLKFREIAEALREPIDTVKSKHRRGLILLRKVMPDHWRE